MAQIAQSRLCRIGDLPGIEAAAGAAADSRDVMVWRKGAVKNYSSDIESGWYMRRQVELLQHWRERCHGAGHEDAPSIASRALVLHKIPTSLCIDGRNFPPAGEI